MNVNYIDNVETYPALIAVNDMVSELPKRRQKYIRSLLNDYKRDIKKLDSLYNANKDAKLFAYLIYLVRDDYIKKIDYVMPKYQTKLLEHIKNYIFAKIRNTFKD